MEGRGTHHSNNSGGGGGGRAHDDSNRSLGYMSIVEAVDGEEDYSDEDDYDEDDYDGAEGEEGGIDGEEEEEEGGFDIRQARAMVEGLERAALSEIASMGSASPPPQHAPAGSFLSSLSAGLGPSAAAAATQGKPAAAGEQGGGGEGYYAPGVDEIAELQGLGDGQRRRRAGARRKKRSKLSPELSRMMGEANMLYMSGDFDDAVNLLLELVRRAPNVSDPYHTLGLIHEDMQDRKKALEFYMIAAHLTPKDATLWKRLGLMSRQENNPKQAIYCYSRAIRLDGRDVDSLWDRSVIYAEMGRLKQASEGFHALLALRPADSEVAKELAKLHHQLSETDKAISVLEETFQHFTAPKSKQQEGKGKENEVQQEANEEEEDEDEAAIDLDLVNMLAELYMGTGQFQKAVELVEATSKKLDTSLEKLPLDLLINFAICQAYLGNLPLAEKYFEILETQKVSSFGDLQFDVAGTLMAVGEYRKALRFYDKLVEGDHNDSSLNEENNHVVNPYNQPTVWMRKAGCYAHLNELENAAEQYEAVLREEPDNAEACLALADIYKTMGQPQRALDVAARQIEHNKSNLSSSINQETMQEQALQPITATSTIPPPLLPPSSSTTTAPSLSSSTSSLPKEQQPADKAAPPEEPLLLDGVDIRVLLQKGLLHFSLKEYEAFLESCYDLVYKATRNGRNSARKPMSKVKLHPKEKQSRQANKTRRGERRQQKRKKPESIEEEPLAVDSILDFRNRSKRRRIGSSSEKKKSGETELEREEESRMQQEEPEEHEEHEREEEQPNERREEEETLQLVADDQKDKDISFVTKVVQIFGRVQYCDLVYKMCCALGYTQRYAEALQIIKYFTTSKFTDKERNLSFQHLAVGLSYRQGNYYEAYRWIRPLCIQRPCNLYWNVLNTVLSRLGNVNVSELNHKFMIRELLKSKPSDPNNLPRLILVGHDCLSSGTTGLALGEYYTAYRDKPKQDLTNLSIGLAHLNMVSNRKVMDRHRHVMLAFAFLFQYKRLRLQHQQGEGEGEGGRSKAKENEDYLQEVCFNLGRAFHQLNLLHLAVPFYEKAISTSPPRSSPYRSAFLSSDEAEERKKNEEEKEEEEKEAETRAREAFDLRREAAYNLSLIYQNSGSHQLAAKLLRTYCTI